MGGGVGGVIKMAADVTWPSDDGPNKFRLVVLISVREEEEVMQRSCRGHGDIFM